MNRDRIDVIYSTDSCFPQYLREIDNPPRKLYYSGDLSLLSSRRAGVVGSRKFTLYGKVIAKALGNTLADAGVSVVSGLAYGIDAFAHEGVRDRGGKAIAVLGMGLDNFSPQQNRDLYEWVCCNGLALSEYEPGFSGSKKSFPARNRLISGISEKLILVEAGGRSGALITARFAAEQGRDIYAVPGNINSQFSLGTNLLIREGVKPLIVLDDVIRDMGADIQKDNNRAPELEADEEAVVEAVMKYNGAGVNEISQETDIKVETVSAILTVLEIKGIIYSYCGKFHLAK